MSAFNVGKKVSTAVRILQRKRDASARATHLKAENWIAQYSTNERKQMSTKTSIKRIALVAAAALTLGGFSAVSAHATASGAATFNVFSAATGAKTAAVVTQADGTVTGGSTSGTAIAGNTASVDLVLNHVAGKTYKASVSTTGGAISAGGNGNSVYTNADTSTAIVAATQAGAVAAVGATKGSVSINGNALVGPTYPTTSLQINSDTAAGAYTTVFGLTVYSATAGTQTLNVSVFLSDGSVVTGTATITWVASSAVGISKANTTIGFVSATSACPGGTTVTTAAGTSTASDQAAIANDTATVTSVAKSTAFFLCVSARDASDNLMSTVSVQAFSSLGGASLGAITVAPGQTTGATGGLSITSGSLTGAATITVLITDAFGNTIAPTAPISVTGSLSSIVLANYNYAAQYAGAPGTGIIFVDAKDSNGTVFDDSAQSFSWTVDSSNIATAAAARTSDSAGASVGAPAAFDLVNYGSHNLATVSCANSIKAEKLTLTAWAKDSNGAWVSSNPITFYCSDASTKGTVTVTPADTSLDAGGTTTVNISALDPNGYPVPDATAVSLSVNNGAGVNTPSTTTLNGAFKYAAVVVAGGSSPISVLAVGPKAASGTASISVTGGGNDTSLSLDAANAATDAANNAYDEAQNATQAASDALAAVTALSAQVGALIATVKSLAAVVAKIKAKVKA